MAISTSFQTLFAVPMTCESCVKDINTSLSKLKGIEKVEANLKDQLVTISGTAAPSAIVAAIQETGRDAILRGSGTTESAAVCILETHSVEVSEKVKGLVRMVQVAPSLTIIDLTIRGLPAGTYHATVRQAGDISNGAVSTGSIWRDPNENSLQARGDWGVVEVNEGGKGSAFFEKKIEVWEIIGRGMVVAREKGEKGFESNGAEGDILVGVVARSAGVWDNGKTVCSCSGKTLWEERKDEVQKGML